MLHSEMCSPSDRMAQAVGVADVARARPRCSRPDSFEYPDLNYGSRFSVHISFTKIPNITTLHVSMVYAFTRRIYFQTSSSLCSWRYVLGGTAARPEGSWLPGLPALHHKLLGSQFTSP